MHTRSQSIKHFYQSGHEDSEGASAQGKGARPAQAGQQGGALSPTTTSSKTTPIPATGVQESARYHRVNDGQDSWREKANFGKHVDSKKENPTSIYSTPVARLL